MLESWRPFLASYVGLSLLLLLGVALLGLGLVAWLFPPADAVYDLRVSGGVVGLNRHGVAEYMRRHAGEVGLRIEVVPSEGTIEATRMLDDGEIDLALVNGVIRRPQLESVRQVAGITVEALHMLVKSEHAAAVETDWNALAQRSIGMGPEGSETNLISKAVLRFCDVPVQRSPPRQSIDELLKTLSAMEAAPDQAVELRESLPDVVFHVSTLPSPLARRLIRTGEYQLVPLPFADAFSRITVEEEDLDRDHLDQLHVVPTTIPAYLYGAAPAAPAQDLPTLGCPLVLAVHADVPDEAVTRLLPRIYSGPVERVFHPPTIRDTPPAYPFHPASIAYRDRDQPLLRADIVDAFQRLAGILAPLLGGALALYGFYRWRQTLTFMEYFEEFLSLDAQAKGLTQDEVVTPAEAEEARRLEAQLTRLQQRAVNDFCQNYFYGEGVLENFLQLLAETRDFLRASARNAAALPVDGRAPSPPDAAVAERS